MRSQSRHRAGLRLSGAATLAALTLALGACTGPGTTTITVNGKVTDPLLTPFGAAYPTATANAYIAGTAVPVKADGSFTITGVTAPYDLIVTIPTFNQVFVYLGLTRPDPTLSLLTEAPPTYSTDVTLSIGTTVAAGDEGAIVAGSTGLVQSPVKLAAGNGPTVGPVTFAWGGAASRQVTLYALTASSSGGPPTAFTGFGSTTATLTDGTSVSGLSVTLGSVSTASMSGTVSAPSGYTVSSAGAVVRLGSPTGALLGIGPGSSSGGAFSGLNVPVHSGIAYGLAGSASNSAGDMTSAWRNVAGTGSGLTLGLPSPAVPTAPASGASGIGPGTTFSWTPLASAVYVLNLNPPSAAEPAVFVFTTGTSFDLPDLTAVGERLPSSTVYHSSLLALGPFGSLDTFAGPDGGLEGWVQLQTLFPSGGGSSLSYGDGHTDAPAMVFWTQTPYEPLTTAP